ncbi:MAG TPA: permease-like cell division protein FtsX [Gammaproteobacteria bacterium]|nr:permease-like cell division protein FtsX [Gammaproteobacteria bacterium]
MAAPHKEGAPRGADAAARGGRLGAWLKDHLRVSVTSLGRLYRNAGTSLMTAAVIGISLSLPAAMQVLIGNVQTLSGSWQGAARISLYLKTSVSDTDARALADKLRGTPGVADVQYISATQALAEFKQLSGFGDAMAVLDKNPLPAVLVIHPADGSPEGSADLEHSLASLPGVDQVRLDLQWLKRLAAILDIVKRVTQILAGLLGLAVVLVVGNTIRLEIGGRRTEIEVSKLLGATDSFIRRPFLYHGAWYGLTGGLMACILVALAVALVESPVSHLAGLYGSTFSLQGLGFSGALGLLGGGALLGWAGSWLAVARHLRAIEPT